LAYQPSANNIFLSQQTSHQQPAKNTFISEQISTSNQLILGVVVLHDLA
jgi:hypothetical protein